MRRLRPLALLIPLLLIVGPWPVAAAGYTVRITTTLEPASLTVAPGDIVTWRNDDGQRHRIRSTSGPVEFDSGNLDPGETYRLTFAVVGSYSYRDERNDEEGAYRGSIVVAAGGSSSSPTGGGDSPAPSGATIGMAGRSFGPRSVTIAAGGSVTFWNDDDRDHTATSTNGAFDSGRMAPGDTYSQAFPSAGTFSFLCLLHPDMTGTVSVSGPAEPTPPPTQEAVATPLTTAPPGPAASSRVAIADLAFEPPKVEVAVGETVSWDNVGIAPHTVTSVDGSFGSGTLEPGDTFDLTFTTAGTFEYICAIHPSMTGSVLVGHDAPEGGAGMRATARPTVDGGAGAGPPVGEPPARPAASIAGAPPGPAGLVSAVLGLSLIGGALAAGLAILLGVVRRTEEGAAG